MIFLTNWSFKNKAAMLIIVIMSLIAGVTSYVMLPMEFLPSMDVPAVTVTAIGPGYDAKSMEKQVTVPIEKAVDGVQGKTDIFSASGDGFAKIDLSFSSDTDMKEAKAEVQAAIDQVQLPPRVMRPFVVQFNTSMIPISWVTISFENGLTPENMDVAENRILREFKKIDGIGNVSITGQTKPVVTIVPDAAKLAERGVPFQALMGVLDGRDVTASIGEQTIGGETGNVKLISDIRDVDMLKQLPLIPGTALGDVADIRSRNDQESFSRVNGVEVLQLVVSKGPDSNAVDIGNEVEKTAERLSEEVPGATVTVLSGTSEQIVNSVNSMIREVLLGALFATIVILLFLRNFRATLITIVSIPLSMVIALYLLNLSGVTLNVITLGGVAVAVGRLVDDSIVVIENIFRRLQKEKFSTTLLIDATGEVAKAITSSTLTTVAVFLPMGLLRGPIQAFLLPFALTVTYSLLSSLLVALTVVPLLGSALLKNSSIREHRTPLRFTAFLRWNLNRKWLPLLLGAALFIGSIVTYAAMPKGAIDSSNAEVLSVTLEYPEGTPSGDIIEAGKKLESFLMKQKEQNWVSMSYGNSADSAQYGQVVSPTLVSFLIEVKKGTDAENIIDNVKKQRPQFPGADLNAGEMDFATNASATEIYIDIIGEDPAELNKAAGLVMEKIRPIDGVLKVKSNQEAKKKVYSFEMDPAVAKAGDIALQLQAMLNPMPIGTLELDGHETSVVLAPLVKPGSVNDLSNITVVTDKGPTSLSSIAKLTETEETSMFYHKGGQTYIRVTATAEPSRLSLAGDDIKAAVNGLKVPDGVKLHVGGASAEQSEDFADLGLTGLLSIFIVYLIMVVTFKTFRAPLAILCSLPLAAIGAVLALLITGVTPDFTAAFGALMLIGIVVTNAIVLIDRVKQNERQMPIREALLEAAGTRMRPILMTALATICAMLPLVFGTSEAGGIVSQSMAVVVIGGLIAATLLTLVIVPCVYEMFYFRKAKRQRAAQ